MNLDEKVILVVGGAQGIGRATVKLCAERGAQMIVADMDVVEGEKAAAESGGQFIKVNVADEVSVSEMALSISKNHGHLDVLIQTAGILLGAYTPIEEFSPDIFRQVIDINVTGSFLCVKHMLPLLRKSKGGVIILTSSGAATGGSSSFAYGTSKGGVNSFAITLANKLAQETIRVNVVSPGNIDTGMKRSVIAADTSRSGTDLNQAITSANLGSPEGVAKVLAWLASDDADYVRGFISTR